MTDQQQAPCLRIALLTADGLVPRWQLSALQAATSSCPAGPPVALELMVVPSSDEPREEKGLWPLVRAVEQRLLSPQRSLWQRIAPHGDRDIARVSTAPEAVTEPSEADQPDLALDCTGLEDTQAWSARARLGLLRVRFGDRLDGAGIDRALVQSRPWIRISVELVTPEQTRVLATTVMALTRSRSFSSAREGACRRARQLLMRAITRLRQGDVGAAAPDQHLGEPEAESRRNASAAPSGWRGLGVLTRSGVDLVVGSARSTLLHVDHWFLAYRTQQHDFIANTLDISGEGFKMFYLNSARFYADPCVLEHEGSHHVFFEDFAYKKKRGTISWSRLQSDGMLSRPTVVLEEPTHLSYPFVFSYQGAVYMIPETTRRREIALYEAEDFPRGWRKARVLFDNVEARDTTLHVHDDRWWMFVTIRQDGFGASDELFLFHARAPFGPWTAHPRNPVKSDVRSARPAGRLFHRGGRLFRPAQDCSDTYGGALVLCEVRELTTTGYREAIVKRLEPGWLSGNRGFHTLSFSDRLEVIDGKLDLPRWRARAVTSSA